MNYTNGIEVGKRKSDGLTHIYRVYPKTKTFLCEEYEQSVFISSENLKIPDKESLVDKSLIYQLHNNVGSRLSPLCRGELRNFKLNLNKLENIN